MVELDRSMVAAWLNLNPQIDFLFFYLFDTTHYCVILFWTLVLLCQNIDNTIVFKKTKASALFNETVLCFYKIIFI